jgi:hypothetical protein
VFLIPYGSVHQPGRAAGDRQRDEQRQDRGGA